jgi:hypothetical protein
LSGFGIKRRNTKVYYTGASYTPVSNLSLVLRKNPGLMDKKNAGTMNAGILCI